jgi:hypothetical protein
MLRSPLRLVVQNEELVGLQGEFSICPSLVIAEFNLIRAIQELYYCTDLSAY